MDFNEADRLRNIAVSDLLKRAISDPELDSVDKSTLLYNTERVFNHLTKGVLNDFSKLGMPV